MYLVPGPVLLHFHTDGMALYWYPSRPFRSAVAMTTKEDTDVGITHSFLLTRHHGQLWTGTTDVDPDLKNE